MNPYIKVKLIYLNINISLLAGQLSQSEVLHLFCLNTMDHCPAEWSNVIRWAWMRLPLYTSASTLLLPFAATWMDQYMPACQSCGQLTHVTHVQAVSTVMRWLESWSVRFVQRTFSFFNSCDSGTDIALVLLYVHGEKQSFLFFFFSFFFFF